MFIDLLSCDANLTAGSAEIVALRPDKPREFSLQTKAFISMPNLPSLSSEKLRFVAEARLPQSLISDSAKANSSFAALVDDLQRNMGGQPITLNISTDDGIARGRSFESLLALSAYCHLEHIFEFAKLKAGVADATFKRPLTVAVYGEILSGDSNSKPISKSDNALYVGSADTVFLLPLGKEEGLPLAMHEGVLAHEFHHRIFFNEVWDNRQFKNLWSLFQSRYDPDQNRLSVRSRVLLNALDEGLADIFAVAFTGLSDYLNISLTQKSTESLRIQRDLKGRFAANATYDSLSDASLENNLLRMCGENANDFTSLKFNVYCLGTVIAKAIYEASSHDIGTLRDKILPAITSSLPAIAARLDQELQFDLDVFFEGLVANVSLHSEDIKSKLCAELKSRFSSLATPERIPSCQDIWKSS